MTDKIETTVERPQKRQVVEPQVFYNCKLIPEDDTDGMLTTVKTAATIKDFEHHRALLFFRLQSLIKSSVYYYEYEVGSEKALPSAGLFQGFVSESESVEYTDKVDYADLRELIGDVLGVDAIAENPIHDIVNSDNYARLLMDLQEKWMDVMPEEIEDDFQVLQNRSMGGMYLNTGQMSFSCLERPYNELVAIYNEYTLDDYLEALSGY